MISQSRHTHFGLQSMDLPELGIKADPTTGHIFYLNGVISFKLECELVFIRHGETFGNCGQTTADGKIDVHCVSLNKKDKDKRIFQGRVDTEINQLTENGKKEALKVASELEQQFKNATQEWLWEPDVILVSPLKRAQMTAEPFVEKNNLKTRVKILDDITEMSFGAWDNRRVCDLEEKHIAHRFYQEQHALIKENGLNANNQYQKAENFVEVLQRAHSVLKLLNKEYQNKKVIMFSHSMFGGALKILLRQGKKIENGDYLAFDGKDSKGEYYTLPHTTPVFFNVTPMHDRRDKLNYS